MSRKPHHNVDLKAIHATIDELQPKAPTSFSSREIIGQLHDVISKTLQCGYNYNDISKILFERHQLKLSAAIIKREYLAVVSKIDKKRKCNPATGKWTNLVK